MRSFSQILKAATEIEKAGGQPFEVLKSCSAQRNSPKCATHCPQTSTPAASLFKLTAVAPKLQNLQTLTTEEKKKISNEILEIAEITAKIAASKQ
jgi:hypothetical protein